MNILNNMTNRGPEYVIYRQKGITYFGKRLTPSADSIYSSYYSIYSITFTGAAKADNVCPEAGAQIRAPFVYASTKISLKNTWFCHNVILLDID